MCTWPPRTNAMLAPCVVSDGQANSMSERSRDACGFGTSSSPRSSALSVTVRIPCLCGFTSSSRALSLHIPGATGKRINTTRPWPYDVSSRAILKSCDDSSSREEWRLLTRSVARSWAPPSASRASWRSVAGGSRR
jgi:hypothetical protein